MKLLDLIVENLPGIPVGTYSFAATPGSPRNLVVFAGDSASSLVTTIAALMEAARAPAPAAYHLAWWASRRGSVEARLHARWVLSESEAARAGLRVRTAVSEWRFGPSDSLPREVHVEGALAPRVRAALVRHVLVDANRLSVWMEADPLAELLAGIARLDVAATRVCCQQGVGIVAMKTPDTFVGLNQAIAQVFPALRIERVACDPGEAPVACFRGGERTELDQLLDVERDAIHLAAEILTARMRDGVVLLDRPEVHVPRDARARWLDWLAGVAGTNQLVVAATADTAASTRHEVGSGVGPSSPRAPTSPGSPNRSPLTVSACGRAWPTRRSSCRPSTLATTGRSRAVPANEPRSR